ncbi:MAG: hypothetical protein ABSD03_05505 [Vulcanimicrobiaceae bacterium]|jgi:hypothetical protein
MTKQLLLSSLAAAVLGTAAALPASAQDSSAPVSLVSWGMRAPIGGTYEGSPDPSYGPDMLEISFVNRGQVAATAVEFVVRSGNREQTIVDRGTFAPGVDIAQEFEPAFVAPTSLEVEAVTFIDGTTWHA